MIAARLRSRLRKNLAHKRARHRRIVGAQLVRRAAQPRHSAATGPAWWQRLLAAFGLRLPTQ